MSKIQTVILDHFDGGMTNDARDRSSSARIIKHLDNYTESSALSVLPDNDATAADRSAADSSFGSPNGFDKARITQFLYAAYLSTATFFGLGVQSGTTKPDIFTKTSVADGAAWTASNHTDDYTSLTTLTASQSLLTGVPTAFTLYRDYIYGLDDNGWWKYGPLSTTPTWTVQATGSFVASGSAPTTKLNVSQPIVHSKDDIMYCTGGPGTLTQNKVIRNNAAVWDIALTFGTYTQLPRVCEYGNYLAIAANNVNGTCAVNLWDRDSSLAGINEVINWGSGTLKWIDTVDGILVGCSIQEPSGLSISPNVVFKYYNGSTAVKFAEFTCSAATVKQFTQRFNNQILFLASLTINGTTLAGTWRVTKTGNGLNVSFDRLPYLDSGSVTSLLGFLQTGDYLHAAVISGGLYAVTKTGNTFGTTAYYETTINPGMSTEDRPKKKQLLSVSVLYDPLAANAGVIVSYKVDSGSWTQIVNDTTDNSTFTENPSVAGTSFTSGRGYEFQIKPAGGAVKITGIVYKYRVIETLI